MSLIESEYQDIDKNFISYIKEKMIDIVYIND